ncbi:MULTISPECIES: helix-turn-helix transcriptional regulator [unclassified Clostridium]|jgi:transcriptional regulator with XRE-family HTH domain|uniref:helix-turn-helix domain-containing protein n=1 Tax=Clostridia TaxID=186801 RepID=UPI001105B901|nr:MULTISPECIES: helix-turn-helix transcriptional regulator [unclassified Clostridium]
MDHFSMGKHIAALRKAKGLTQDELAEQLGVSPQAVSKWENDLSCPDIMLLPRLAKIFGVTVDELLGAAPPKTVALVPEGERKNLDDLMLRIVVNSAKGDKVRVNLPMQLVKMGLEIGMSFPEFAGNDSFKGSEVFKNIDLDKILLMVEKGAIGRLVEVESAQGDIVEVVVE